MINLLLLPCVCTTDRATYFRRFVSSHTHSTLPSRWVCAGLWEPCSLTPNLLINSEGSQLTKAWKPHMAPQHRCHVALPSLSVCVCVTCATANPSPKLRLQQTNIYTVCSQNQVVYRQLNPLSNTHSLALLSLAPQAYFKCLFCWIISWCCGRCLVWQQQYVSAWFDCRATLCLYWVSGDKALWKVTSGSTQNKRVCGFSFSDTIVEGKKKQTHTNPLHS